jgi:alpha-D-ribose 1-methylphosphonate 5-triphosphate synthase subunit PhnH
MFKESKFDQIFDAQNVFRIILESYSHPGLLYSFDEYKILKQDFWLASNAIIALSLFDNNVSFHVVDPINQPLIEEYIHLNTSAKLSCLKEADYIFLDGKEDLTRILNDAKIGEVSYPEKMQQSLCR